MKGVLIGPDGKCKIVTFPTHQPASVLSRDLTVDHCTLGALNRRGQFGIFCEYGGDEYNAVATRITNLLNFDSKNVNHTNVCGRAVFYRDDGDVTAEDWAYARRMIKAKRTRTPTEEYRAHLQARQERNLDEDDSLLAQMARRYDKESAAFWKL